MSCPDGEHDAYYLHSSQKISPSDQAPTMTAIAPRRPLANIFSPLPLSLHFLPAARRHESSTRRTTKKLRVKPDPTFKAFIHPDKVKDHIVFNPPSSAPSPYYTPVAFLPRNDPRRRLLAESHSHANPYQGPDDPLPPAVRKPHEKKYHLTDKDIVEIRRLRTEDPSTWTRTKLAEKFECSPFFVGMVVPVSEERLKQKRLELEEVKSKWGPKRRIAREQRAARRATWGRDE